MQNGQPVQQLDWSKAQELQCVKCNGDIFLPAVKVKKLSRLVSMLPNDVMGPYDVFLCANCGTVCEELIPEEFKNKKIKPVNGGIIS